MTLTLNRELSDLPMNAFAIAREFAVTRDASRSRAAAPPATSGALDQLQGTSAPMKALYDMIQRVAPTRSAS